MENERAYFEAMSTEELRAIIPADYEAMERETIYPSETIDLICNILAARLNVDLDESWRRFCERLKREFGIDLTLDD